MCTQCVIEDLWCVSLRVGLAVISRGGESGVWGRCVVDALLLCSPLLNLLMPSPLLPPSLQKPSLVLRSCWGSTRLSLWPIQTSGPLHPSPPLQNPQPNPIFRLRSCPALPEHLAVSFYPALQASEETGLFCAWQSLIWLQKWKWSHGSSLGEAGVHRDPAQVKELGGGGTTSVGEAGWGGIGLVGVSILKTQWWASGTPPYTYTHTHVHTSSPSRPPTPLLHPST